MLTINNKETDLKVVSESPLVVEIRNQHDYVMLWEWSRSKDLKKVWYNGCTYYDAIPLIAKDNNSAKFLYSLCEKVVQTEEPILPELTPKLIYNVHSIIGEGVDMRKIFQYSQEVNTLADKLKSLLGLNVIFDKIPAIGSFYYKNLSCGDPFTMKLLVNVWAYDLLCHAHVKVAAPDIKNTLVSSGMYQLLTVDMQKLIEEYKALKSEVIIPNNLMVLLNENGKFESIEYISPELVSKLHYIVLKHSYDINDRKVRCKIIDDYFAYIGLNVGLEDFFDTKIKPSFKNLCGKDKFTNALLDKIYEYGVKHSNKSLKYINLEIYDRVYIYFDGDNVVGVELHPDIKAGILKNNTQKDLHLLMHNLIAFGFVLEYKWTSDGIQALDKFTELLLHEILK